MATLTHKDLQKLMKVAYGPVFNSENKNLLTEELERPCLMITGAPGIGKSYVVREFAKSVADRTSVGVMDHGEYIPNGKIRRFLEWNKTTLTEKKRCYFDDEYRSSVFLFVDMRVAQRDVVDLAGMPNTKEVDGLFTWNLPLVLSVLTKPGTAGILFLDEFSCANNAIQNACLQLINDHAIGDSTLGRDVWILAAGNTAEHRASVFELSGPMCNRFCHCELTAPKVDDWCKDFAFKNGVDERIVTFLKWKPEAFLADPKQIKDTKCRAFPTPRSWTKCSHLIKGLTEDECELPAAATVGDACAANFMAYLKVFKSIDPEAIFSDPKGTVAKYSKDAHMLWAVTSIVVSRYVETPKILPKVMEIVECLWETKDWSEYAVALISMIAASKVHSESNDFFSKLMKVNNGKYSALVAKMHVLFGKLQ